MNILLAEDNEDDVLLLRTVLKKARGAVSIHVTKDGDETIRYLKGDGDYSNRQKHPFPALLLLDLKMPRKNGFEVLEWIRTQPALNPLPIVVLTSSDLKEDIEKAYQFHVNSYLSKGPLAQSPEVFAGVLDYWWNYNEIPKSKET
jgi:CheY-like chemotaxis protein